MRKTVRATTLKTIGIFAIFWTITSIYGIYISEFEHNLSHRLLVLAYPLYYIFSRRVKFNENKLTYYDGLKRIEIEYANIKRIVTYPDRFFYKELTLLDEFGEGKSLNLSYFTNRDVDKIIDEIIYRGSGIGIEKVSKKSSGNKTFNKALKLARENNYQDAIPLIEQACIHNVDGFPKDQVYNIAGGMYLDTREYEKALEKFNIATSLKRDNYNALNNRGIALKKLKRYEEAEKSYLDSLAINPNFFNARTSLGALYTEIGEYDKALEEQLKAIESDPEEGSAYSSAALAYAFLGDFISAFEYNERAKTMGYANWATFDNAIKKLQNQNQTH